MSKYSTTTMRITMMRVGRPNATAPSTLVPPSIAELVDSRVYGVPQRFAKLS